MRSQALLSWSLLMLLVGIAALVLWAYLISVARPHLFPSTPLRTTTFSDGSSSQDISYAQAGNQTITVSIPINASLHEASLSLAGSAHPTIDSTTALSRPASALETGDLDGDGRDELIIGQPEQNRVLILWGSSRTTNITGVGPRFGSTLAAGDLNADGRDDLIIGQPDVGRVIIVWGDKTDAFPASTLVIEGKNESDHFGYSLATGDLDGDGYQDLIIGAPQYKDRSWQGRVYIYWGAPSRSLASATSQTLTGEGRGDDFGWALATGDLNKDGRDDLIVGAPSWPSSTYYGRAYVYWGNATRSLIAASNTTFTGEGYDNEFGSSLATGDVDGDGYQDLIVGAPGADRAYLYRGSPSAPSTSLTNTTLHGPRGSGFGHHVIATDIDGDGVDDIIVSMPQPTVPASAGSVHLYWGSRSGWPGSASLSLSGDAAGDLFGKMITAGKLDGNETDLIIAAPSRTNGTASGMLYVYRSSASLPTEVELSCGMPVWSHHGPVSTPTSIDLNTTLSRILADNCTCPCCSAENDACLIPLTFTTRSAGTLHLTNLSMVYT